MLLFILVYIFIINNCCSELSGQARLVISVSNHAYQFSTQNNFLLTPDVLHFTYYFRHISIAKNNETVYVIAIRVLDELANHSRTLSSHYGIFWFSL